MRTSNKTTPQTAPPASAEKLSLLDIMSEQLAHSFAEEDLAPIPVFLPLEKLEGEAEKDWAHYEDMDEAAALDLALALQLQEEEDALLMSELQSKHRPQGNVTLRHYSKPVLPEIKPLAFVDVEDELLSYPKPTFRRDKTLKGQGGEGEIITKHDKERSETRNALFLDKFVPANQCGSDIASSRLPNATYNSLSQQVKRQQDRSMAPTSKPDASTFPKGLNRKTTRILQNLVNAQIIDFVRGMVRTGKEANIFHCETAAGQEYAVKVYKTNGEFVNRREYIDGDERFEECNIYRLGEDKMVEIWSEKEMKNLSRLVAAGVPAPEPVRLVKNVLVMSFIGERSICAPQLSELSFSTQSMRQECFVQCLLLVRALYSRCALVHADLSEYNMLFDSGNNRVVLVDLGQAVDLSHPRANEYLRRDVRNVLTFFARHNALVDDLVMDEVCTWIQQGSNSSEAGDVDDLLAWREFAQGLGDWADAQTAPRFASLIPSLL